MTEIEEPPGRSSRVTDFVVVGEVSRVSVTAKLREKSSTLPE